MGRTKQTPLVTREAPPDWAVVTKGSNGDSDLVALEDLNGKWMVVSECMDKMLTSKKGNDYWKITFHYWKDPGQTKLSAIMWSEPAFEIMQEEIGIHGLPILAQFYRDMAVNKSQWEVDTSPIPEGVL